MRLPPLLGAPVSRLLANAAAEPQTRSPRKPGAATTDSGGFRTSFEGRAREHGRTARDEDGDAKDSRCAGAAALRLPLVTEFRPAKAEAPADRLAIEQLAQEMLHAVSIRQGPAGATIELELSGPQGQGLKLKLSMVRGRLCANFAVAEAGTYNLLVAAAGELQAALAARGIDVDTIDVRRDLPVAHRRQRSAGRQRDPKRQPDDAQAEAP